MHAPFPGPRRPLPPGPRTLRPSGHRNEIRKDVLGFYRALATRYPDVSSFRVFWIRVVFLSDPALVHRLLRLGPDDVRQSRSLRGLRAVLGDGLLTSEGETWRRERERVQPAFRHDLLRSYAPMMVRHARSVADGWRDGEVVDLHEAMSALTLGAAAEALFGAELSSDVAAVGEALARVMDRFEEAYIRSVFPVPLQVPTPANLRLRRTVKDLHRVVDGIVERRLDGASQQDLLTDLIAAAREDDTPRARQRLRDEVLTLLLAGHETTALALTWALYLLARNPEEETRLLEERERVLGGRDPGVDDLARLPLLRRVVQEALRLYPPAWGVGREAVRELTLGGHRIPKGAQIFALPWVTHRDPAWFPEPGRFLPDRWLPDARAPDGTPMARKEAYLPFGAGPRACVGAGFALMEVPLVLATLLGRWRVEVADDLRPELQPAVTLRPRSGVPATVRRRDGAGPRRSGAR